CTHIYFKRLMESMGEKVKFAIDEVCQGAGRTAAVMWHLEWNGYIIPFSRGCSFYICSVNGAVLLIRKIHIFNESPLKPGKWALEILNIVTNLFNVCASTKIPFMWSLLSSPFLHIIPTFGHMWIGLLIESKMTTFSLYSHEIPDVLLTIRCIMYYIEQPLSGKNYSASFLYLTIS
ncbi:hypothetical protein ACJX0J_010805, partial [Zea mays]